MNELAYVDGRFVPLGKAKISVMDLAIQRAYGIAEPFRSYHGAPFAMREHLARLKNSAKLLGLSGLPKISSIAQKIREGLKRVGQDCVIKVMVTGGDSHHLLPESRPRLVILFMRPPRFPPRFHERGVTIKSFPYERPYPGAKTLDYLTAVSEQRKMAREGFSEILFLDRHHNILECSTANFAIIKNKQLITPKASVLPGVTLGFILQLAPRAGLKVERRRLGYAELRGADEAFISSVNRQIVPVIKVDKIRIGPGRPGPYVKKLLTLFRELVP